MGQLKLINQKDLILKLYDSGIKVAEIARRINEYKQSVGHLIKKFRDVKQFCQNRGNVHYFDEINSNSKAYILGFIAADGALVKGKTTTTLTITLKYTDKCILEFIKSEIGNSHNLMEIKRPCSFDKSKMIHHIRYSISDKNIYNALLNLGIDYNKSLSMGNIIKNIPFEFRNAFVIGYFDGDGSVCVNNQTKTKFINKDNCFKTFPCYNLGVSIRGTFDFLSGIADHIKIDNPKIKKYDSIPRLDFSKKSDVVKFYKCYDGLQFFLKRKHDVFLSRINHPSYDKYK